MTEASRRVLLEKGDCVAWITLNRIHAANALSLDLLQQLSNVLQSLSMDEQIRVVVIKGAGDQTFCAGADLKERARMSQIEAASAVQSIRTVIDQIQSLPQPAVACLNGSAFGGGLELAIACDLRVAASHAVMGLTETSLGIIPGAGGTQRLPRLIGIAKAKELIYTAKRITANEALGLGLVDQVCPKEQLESVVSRLADQIACNAPLAVRAARQAINSGMEVDLASGLAIEKLSYEKILPTEDRLEGLRAFAEKRKPNYRGV